MAGAKVAQAVKEAPLSPPGEPVIHSEAPVAPRSPAAVMLRGKFAIPAALLFLVVLFSLLRPHTFFTTGNLYAILGTQATLLMVALALTLPLRGGDFDLSVGSVVAFTMALAATLTVNHGWSWPLAMIAVVVVGVIVGAVNAAFIVGLGVNAFIVTLGTGTLLGGLTLAITSGQSVGPAPAGLRSLATTKLLGFPLVTFYSLVLALILWYVYEHTPLGRRILFVGGSIEAARLAGVRVKRTRSGVFIGASAICALVGVLALGQSGYSDSTIDTSLLLPAYAAAFLGATTIRPGRFNAWGTVFGLLLIETGITGLILLGVPAWVEDVFNGAVLVVAVAIAQIFSPRRD